MRSGSGLATGVLFREDNLVQLREFPSASVDLIYLDPPFFSNSSYEVVFGDEDEVRTFHDRWSGGILHYIEWMRPRVVELHRVLKPTGSFYLHCDWHAHAHLRLLLDDVFGAACFRNSIVWSYRRWPDKRFGQYQRMHDDILFFTKQPGRGHTFNMEYEAVSASFQKRFGGKRQILDPEQPTRKIVTDEETKGLPRRDVWEISIIAPAKKERLKYPTQKPEALLERLIRVSSNEGDIVLDPFCGCGTTVAVAHKLGRRWIGIDVASTAIQVCEGRLLALGAAVKTEKMPRTVETLLKLGPFAFQNWVINHIRGELNPRRTGDLGIDGHSYVGDPVQVKRSRKVGREVVDAFQTAIRRDAKQRGFVIAGGFTRGAYEEAARSRQHGLEITLVRVDELLKHDRMVTAGLIPARLFMDDPYVPHGRPAARPTAEQLMLSLATPDEEPLAEEPAGPAAPQPKPDPAKLADDLLRQAGIEHPPVRLEPILQSLNVETSERPGLDGDARLVAMTDPRLGPTGAWIIYYNPARSPARRRFTFAHEVGHALIHGAEASLAASARGAGGRRGREREADKFATALLMPERFVRSAVQQYGVNVERLRALFLVSRPAMERRLRELGLS